jgi:hypothetical protein
MIYSEENIKELLQIVNGSGIKTTAPYTYWKQLKYDLQVHTKGKLFEKITSVYKNEDKNATEFVLKTFEPITKGSIWKGIDNVARIFKHTGFDIAGSKESIKFITEKKIKEKIIENFIEKSIATDPNTFAVPYFENGKWETEFIESEQIESITDDYIVYINDNESDYTLVKKSVHRDISVLLNDYEKNYSRKSFIFVSKYQYISIVSKEGKQETTIIDLKNEIEPYVPTGVNPQLNNVFESPVQGFIPFGNKALLQHRTAVSVENLFGYPRMSELELPCDQCTRGEVACDITDACPSGYESCTKCDGTGSVSLQSIFKIYKRKLSAENPELNIDIDPVRFHTPDIGILEYVSKAWKETLQLAEDSIYIQQRNETGNVESAKSREKQLEQMYSWLDRISTQFYENAKEIINNELILNNLPAVEIEKPISFAIMSELESFEYLNLIVNSDSPIYIKTAHTENFLKKYISSSNPIIKIVDILKKIDIFCFYTSKDLQTLSNSGIIDDKQWRIHAYAFPVLSQMYALDSYLFELSDDVILRKLNTELDKYMPKELLSAASIDGGGG